MFDLSLFYVNGEFDLRINPFKEEENNGDLTMNKDKYPLEKLGGPMTRAREMKSKEALQQVFSILF